MTRALSIAAFALGSFASAGEQAAPDPFQELDATIAKSLERDKFSQASRDFLKVLWQEYKEAFQKNERRMDWHGGGEKAGAPDIKTYAEYVGRYARADREPAAPFIEVTTDAGGRFRVKLEGHTIPAVAWNRGILFTTGNIVYSDLPDLGSKPHATMEMVVITLYEGQFVLASPQTPAWRGGRRLKKLEP
jgi:hypothetical protein